MSLANAIEAITLRIITCVQRETKLVIYTLEYSWYFQVNVSCPADSKGSFLLINVWGY